jgi:hypothetical protein
LLPCWSFAPPQPRLVSPPLGDHRRLLCVVTPSQILAFVDLRSMEPYPSTSNGSGRHRIQFVRLFWGG